MKTFIIRPVSKSVAFFVILRNGRNHMNNEWIKNVRHTVQKQMFECGQTVREPRDA